MDEVCPAAELPHELADGVLLELPRPLRQSGWTPRNGLGASYLCRVLRANRISVQKVLATLHNADLIQRRQGLWCPSLVNLDWLADKWDGVKSANTTPKVQWVDLPDGKTATIPTEEATYADRPATDPDGDKCLKRIVTRLRQSPNTPDMARQKVILLSLVHCPAWDESPYGCCLKIDRELDYRCKAGEEWQLVEEWVRLHGDGAA